jgi:hypothetical protein
MNETKTSLLLTLLDREDTEGQGDERLPLRGKQLAEPNVVCNKRSDTADDTCGFLKTVM